MVTPIRIGSARRSRLTRATRSETGAARGVGSYLMMFVLAVLLYLGFVFGPAYLEKDKLEEKIRVIARHARTDPNRDDLMREIRKEIDFLGLEVPPENVEIRQDEAMRWIEVRVRYLRTVRLIGGKEIPLDFAIQAFERL
jgi:hypothetical protein